MRRYKRGARVFTYIYTAREVVKIPEGINNGEDDMMCRMRAASPEHTADDF